MDTDAHKLNRSNNAEKDNILAIDYGTKTVGLAVYVAKIDAIMPLESINNTKELLKNLKQIINDYNINLVLIGIPSNKDLKYKILEFFKAIKDKILTNVILVNEDNSSRYTKDMIRYTDISTINYKNKDIKKKKERGAFDALSASIILERFLKCT